MTGWDRYRPLDGGWVGLLRRTSWRVRCGIVVEREGAVVVVRSAGDDEHRLRQVVRALPAAPASVVVGTTGKAVLPVLARVVADRAGRGAGVVRLVAPGGLPAVDPSWWRRLAEATGVELLVPSGPVAVAGGTLFVRGDHERLPGTWRRYAPGGSGRDLGPRHPPPHWQDAVPASGTRVHGRLIAEHLPVGVVLRPAATAPPAEWHAVAPDPHRVTVIVGVPGGPRVCAEDVTDYLATLLPEVCAAARLVCGDGQDAVTLGRTAAGLLGTAVTVVDGTPVVRGDEMRFTLRDGAGRPTWAPYLQEIRCPAGEASAAPLRWRVPVAGLVPHSPGVFRVDDGWLLGVMRSGLWLRRNGRPPHPVPVGPPVDPAVVTLAVGDPGEPLPEQVWPVLADLVDRLDADVLPRLRLSVLGEPGPRGRAAARELARGRDIGIRLPGAVSGQPLPGPVRSRSSASTSDRPR
ncbi:hypothetical protein [Saccharothrix syringae]|uniref:Uncharacterized protein n=1 Tax=Saccharothrix syringae TaxID=103733 RepID=A0A5Q0GYN3_SACSY|nr:hypothetical protein [Saccharothrix syringae]QFZ18600.1 hypothetical protein EKG83_15035 [Saccharothrix syringae]